MFYLTRRLHLPGGEVLCMQVVEVADGVVRGFSPFDVERQSMLWVEEGFLSHSPGSAVVGDMTAGETPASEPLFLYSCATDECAPFSPLIRMM